MRRRLAILSLLVLTGLVAVVFAGGQVAMCLGPIGVTQVQCIATTGIYPSAGPGPAVLIGVVGLAFIDLVAPALDARRLLTLGGFAALGAIAGAVEGRATWPGIMQGPTSSGASLTIPWPLDGWVVVAHATAGAVFAAVALSVWWRLGPRDRHDT